MEKIYKNEEPSSIPAKLVKVGEIFRPTDYVGDDWFMRISFAMRTYDGAIEMDYGTPAGFIIAVTIHGGVATLLGVNTPVVIANKFEYTVS